MYQQRGTGLKRGLNLERALWEKNNLNKSNLGQLQDARGPSISILNDLNCWDSTHFVLLGSIFFLWARNRTLKFSFLQRNSQTFVYYADLCWHNHWLHRCDVHLVLDYVDSLLAKSLTMRTNSHRLDRHSVRKVSQYRDAEGNFFILKEKKQMAKNQK